MSRRSFTLALLTPLVAAAGVATAQPKFEYGKAADVKDVKETEWTATAEAGLVLATGNSRTTTVTGSAKATRKQAENKFAAEASGTFARASTLVAADANLDGDIDENEVSRTDKDSARNYAAKIRYDRFLTEFNSLFVAALAGADPLAGKDFVGGGQLGYARLIYKTDIHEISGEFGYDFSYENFATDDATAVQSVQIHSARGFVGHKAKISDVTSFDASVEILDNLNGNDATDSFEDLRVNLGLSLSTKLSDDISFSFSFGAKYDKAPAPLALPDVMLDATNPPVSSKMDTTTKASLIINLL